MAAGCWSGFLIHDLIRNSEVVLDVPVKSRKGHLLVLENFNFLQQKHGLMDILVMKLQLSISPVQHQEIKGKPCLFQ